MRELLERAARNAGYEIHWHDECVINNGQCGVDKWNPAESDADAFRLMVDCKLSLVILDDEASAGHSYAFDEYTEKFSSHNNDKAAATRMAILRAAAGEE